MFAQDVFNQATIDVATASIGARVSTANALDGFANYQITGIDEGTPTGNGIPIARHTASLGMVWRPLPDLSLFARGAYSSRRKLVVRTAEDPARTKKTSPTILSAVGATLSNVFANTDLEVWHEDLASFLVKLCQRAVSPERAHWQVESLLVLTLQVRPDSHSVVDLHIAPRPLPRFVGVEVDDEPDGLSRGSSSA